MRKSFCLKGHGVVRAPADLRKEGGEGVEIIHATGGIDGLGVDRQPGWPAKTTAGENRGRKKKKVWLID